MKRSLVSSWPVMLLMVLVASCGKEESIEGDVSQYFIKCKIGSVSKTFNISAAVDKIDVGGGTTSYAIFGKAVADATNFESLGFTIQISIPFVTGTYKETDPTSDYLMAGIYNPNTIESDKIFVNQGDNTNPLQVTFTEITSTTLSGTFSGKLFVNNGDPNPESAVITNGQFKVKIQ